jgi:amino acid transporter
MKSTLGLTGLTMNAMALIAPGAFLWLTYQQQCLWGAPMAGSDMWFGIVAAILLCFATAISYAELSKLYPGAGSSYFFAEQAFLSKTHAYKFARLSKYIIGWASHLYYWVYPGLMVGVTAILVGYMAGQIWPDTFNNGLNSPTLMIGFCVIFAFGVSYIAFRGVVGATGVNIAINIIQISALLIFSVIAIGYRLNHGDGKEGWTLDSDGNPVKVILATFKTDQFDANNNPVKKDKDGNPEKDKDGNLLDKDGKVVASPSTLPVDKDGKALEMKDGHLTTASMAMAVADPGGAVQKDPDGNWIVSMKDGKAEPFVLNYAVPETFKVDKDGKPVDKDGKSLLDDKGNLPESAVDKLVQDDAGKEVNDPKTGKSFLKGAVTQESVDANDASKGKQATRQYFSSAADVVKPHGFGLTFIQACIAILILVGFESVTSMGEEAKNAKRDIPRAVLLSLFIQGVICYLIEYFAANYFLNPGYKMTAAAASSAPIGDMMKLVGAWLFGSPEAGIWFMKIQALTVFLALIGTTLSCINTGARVTYAMGRDDEVPSHFGMLHGKNLTPHRAIWTLAVISVFVGIITVIWANCSPAATDLYGSLTDAQKASIWYPKFLTPGPEMAKVLPNSLLLVTLTSNFGTFMLYMLTCVIAIVAFREHHSFSGFKHMVIPVFGLLANLCCMLFYLIGPLFVPGMSAKESYIALGVAAVWGVYGLFYFSRASKKKGKPVFSTVEQKAAGVAAG